MARSARDIEAKALKLPLRERARLAERLRSSLDGKCDDVDVEAEWVREAARRLDDLRSGKANGKAAAGVFRRVRAALR